MLMPNVIVIDARKAGTTWIHRRLAEHPGDFGREGEVQDHHAGEPTGDEVVQSLAAECPMTSTGGPGA